MKFYFTEHCQKTFTQILAFFNLFLKIYILKFTVESNKDQPSVK